MTISLLHVIFGIMYIHKLTLHVITDVLPSKQVKVRKTVCVIYIIYRFVFTFWLLFHFSFFTFSHWNPVHFDTILYCFWCFGMGPSEKKKDFYLKIFFIHLGKSFFFFLFHFSFFTFWELYKKRFQIQLAKNLFQKDLFKKFFHFAASI